MSETQLFAALNPSTLAGLRDSIRRLGVLVPVAVDQHGAMLDGHHRKAVADELGVKYRVDVIQCGEGQADEIRRTLNVDRRHLTGDALRQHVVVLAQLRRPDGVGALSQNQIAERVGVSQQYVGQVLADAEVTTTSNLPTHRQGSDGKVYKATRPAVVAAKNEREAERAQTALALVKASGIADVKDVERDARLQVKAERVAEIASATPEPLLSLGPFPVLYADPPWRYDFAETSTRQIENHYPTMSLDEIKALDVPAADDAVLFLWATSPKLTEALDVLAAWGFTYVTSMVWVKDKIGMGYYARQQHELVLIGKRGSLRTPDPEDRPPSVLTAPRSEHSAKPDEFFALIERMYPFAEKCELFQRRPRERWAGWGNQAAS